MCGRYVVAVNLDEIASVVGATNEAQSYGAHYNIAPSQDAPILLEHDAGRSIRLGRFGLIPADSESVKAVGTRYFNLRSESVTQPRFLESAIHRRCLIVANGFYEWKREGAKKTPYFIHPTEDAAFMFAGIYDTWTPRQASVTAEFAISESVEETPAGAMVSNDSSVLSFSILTAPAADSIAPVHDRMPLIVSPDLWDAWLGREPVKVKTLISELRAQPLPELELRAVGPRVGNVRFDDARLIEPANQV